ncbi:hypothetical protein [Pseudalkalibacillus berkeleyi]|uniref:Uncharacterized protein n=1 Tax=Pseudalkalibacillus berkeleyi TaxID=1069813 RepID=A0ABS9H392_9BACL|nr:hypothetical protein [Pseudalkalibacillus berkeleyi]MCF6139412.1 hypothetical protein [Pseudalkalibacillus berkeleyi]
MNTFSGTARLIYFDIRIITKLMWMITLLLSIAWILAGVAFDLSGFSTSIAGPLYIGLFVIYPIITVTNSFRYAIGLGSTRIQFLKVFYAMGILTILFNMVLFNILYSVLSLFTDKGVIEFEFLHTAEMITKQSFLAYTWIDLMSALTLFGCSFFIAALWFRIGFIRFALTVTLLAFVGYILQVMGGFNVLYEQLSTLNGLTGFSLLGAVGAILLVASYPVLKDAPIKFDS